MRNSLLLKWLPAAQFEIQQLNLKATPQVLANAIGKAPRDEVTEKLHFST